MPSDVGRGGGGGRLGQGVTRARAADRQTVRGARDINRLIRQARQEPKKMPDFAARARAAAAARGAAALA